MREENAKEYLPQHSRSSSNLMDVLSDLASCAYLSDLKNTSNRPNVQAALKSVRPDDFPLSQWEDAIHYILMDTCSFTSCTEARDYMIEQLKKQDLG